MNEMERKIFNKLKSVKDPEIKYGVVDLGYINKIVFRKGKAKIWVVLTTPLCPYGGLIFELIEKTVKSVKGVKKVELEYDWDHPWSVNKVKPEIRKKLRI